jgi:hypothetical protein
VPRPQYAVAKSESRLRVVVPPHLRRQLLSTGSSPATDSRLHPE